MCVCVLYFGFVSVHSADYNCYLAHVTPPLDRQAPSSSLFKFVPLIFAQYFVTFCLNLFLIFEINSGRNNRSKQGFFLRISDYESTEKQKYEKKLFVLKLCYCEPLVLVKFQVLFVIDSEDEFFPSE